MIPWFHPQKTPVSILGQVRWGHPPLLCVLEASSGSCPAGRILRKRYYFHMRSAKPPVFSILSPAETTRGISEYIDNIDSPSKPVKLPPPTRAQAIRVMTPASQGLIYLSTAFKFSGSIFRNEAGVSVPKSLVATGSVTDFNRNKNRVTRNKGVIQITSSRSGN